MHFAAVVTVDSNNQQAVTLLHTFSALGAVDGINPAAPLLLATTGNLYGSTQTGGNSNSGTLWLYNTTSHFFSTLHHFGVIGSSDGGGMMAVSDNYCRCCYY